MLLYIYISYIYSIYIICNIPSFSNILGYTYIWYIYIYIYIYIYELVSSPIATSHGNGKEQC